MRRYVVLALMIIAMGIGSLALTSSAHRLMAISQTNPSDVTNPGVS